MCAGLLVGASMTMVSCAHESSTTTSTSSAAPGSSTTVVKETTVVKDDDPNIVSRTVDILGQIIALPFRLVAGLFELIF
jgi:hypothetical protein